METSSHIFSPHLEYVFPPPPIDLSWHLQQKSNRAGFYMKKLQQGMCSSHTFFFFNACILGRDKHTFKIPLK